MKTADARTGSTVTSSDVAFEIRNATLDYTPPGATRFSGVRDLDLSCRRGEIVVLVGHSGCGKTTTLNMLAGLSRPTSGTVEVLGGRPESARSQMGYMFARDALYPWRTARRNVELGMQIAGVDRHERSRRATEMLDKVGLSAVAKHYPWQCSQGMRQRIALARTWVTRPALILMDEPFSALDAQTRDVMREEFLRVWSEERQTVVFVTHDLNEALLIGDRIVAMNAGRIALDITVDLERPRAEEDLVEDARYRAMHQALRAALND